MNQNNNLLILGLGSIGMRHALNAKKKKTVFGYDPSEKKRKIAKKNGIKVIYNRKESKNISNDVIICSPSDCHESDLNFCSSFAKKILVEKPFVIDVRNGEKLLKKCEINGIKVYTAFVLRFHKIVRLLKEIIDKNTIGKVLWANFIASSHIKDWRPDSNMYDSYSNNKKSGGVLYDYCHEIDLVQFLFGKMKLIFGFALNTKSIQFNTDDLGSLTMISENKTVCNIQLDFCSNPKIRKGIVKGQKGVIYYDLLQREIKIFDENNNLIKNYKDNSSFDLNYQEELNAFLDDDEEFLATSLDGLNVSKIVLSARKKIYE